MPRISRKALSAAILTPMLLSTSIHESPDTDQGGNRNTLMIKDVTGLAPSLPIHPSEIPPDLYCLALNIYHEARSEPETGQIAVARVTLNRVESDAFPETICEVVQQGGQTRNRCQFSWWCDGKSDHPTEETAWRRSLEIGLRVLSDQVSDPTHGALYYHADYVSPSWARAFNRTVEIGRHRFYRPTQI